MYKARFKLHGDSVDESRQRICLPILVAYELHSVVVSVSGKAEEEGQEFTIQHPFLIWNEVLAGYRIEATDSILVDANYHYKSSYSNPTCVALSKEVIAAARDAKKFYPAVEEKRSEFFIKHYIDAQFSLDNGLFKEAALNFGTALEAILNRSLTKGDNLKTLIEQEEKLETILSQCDLIRQFRNKVHPNNIAGASDVNRQDAQQCRSIFERVLGIYLKDIP